MKTLDLVQKTPEWLATRAGYPTASEASAMMGVSKTTKRNELLHAKATKNPKEFSRWVEEVLFAKGHEVEALARPAAAAFIGDDLYPVTATDDDDYLLASFDGVTMLEDVIWECKQWNAQKAEVVNADKCPQEDYWQVVQQLLVSGAERCLYTVTDGGENTVNTWVYPNEDDFQKLLAGWAQFQKDLAEYTPKEIKPEAVAGSINQLPALNIQIKGEVSASNIDAYSRAATEYISGINTALTTDQEFADAEAAVKFLKGCESDLEAAKKQAISQTADIELLLRTVEDIKEQARAKRLELEKLVKSEKENRKNHIVSEGLDKLAAHLSTLRKELQGQNLIIENDFWGAIKGKRTITSIQDAVDTELARCKIEADQIAGGIRANLKVLEEYQDYKFLFNDLGNIITKAPDDFILLVKARVLEHKEAERQKEAATREKIRQEEAARLQEENERAKREEQAKIARQQEAKEREAAIAAKEKAVREYDQQAKAAHAAEMVAPKLKETPENIVTEPATVATVAPETEPESRSGFILARAEISLMGHGVSASEAKRIVGLIAEGKITNISINY